MLNTLISVLLAMALTFTGALSYETGEIKTGALVSFGSWPQNRYLDERAILCFRMKH